MIKPMPKTASTMKAIAFDFDGTIADSFPVFVHGVEYAINRKFTHEEVEYLRQHSAREVVKILKVSLWRAPFLAAKCTREIDRHQDDVTIFPGMGETLKALRKRGHKLYIVSSHSGQGIALFLKRYGLEQEFEHIYSKVGLFGKPKALKKIQRRFKHRATDCVFVGDEIRDIEAARKARIQCIAVDWGFNPAKSLKVHGPTALVSKPEEIIEAVEALS
jgi:HAD superfamily hydrolase (TIGR01509 family)